MKTTFTLFASLIMSIAIMAAPADKGIRSQNMLTIRSFDRGSIRVVIDGRRFEPNGNSIKVQNIPSGLHQLKIYREINNGVFSIFGKRYEVVYNSSFNVRPRTNLTFSVDRFGKTSITESRLDGWNRRDDRSFGDKVYGDTDSWNKEADFDFDRDGKTGDYDNGREDRLYQEYGYKAISDYDFSNVLSAIQKEWFDNNKAESATQIINSNYLTSSQVKQLLQLFTFESNKLDLAKLAYAKTVDQKNYFLVNEVFSFDSSKDELARYIRQR